LLMKAQLCDFDSWVSTSWAQFWIMFLHDCVHEVVIFWRTNRGSLRHTLDYVLIFDYVSLLQLICRISFRSVKHVWSSSLKLKAKNFALASGWGFVASISQQKECKQFEIHSRGNGNLLPSSPCLKPLLYFVITYWLSDVTE
jgi:hypothetical protein